MKVYAIQRNGLWFTRNRCWNRDGWSEEFDQARVYTSERVAKTLRTQVANYLRENVELITLEVVNE